VHKKKPDRALLPDWHDCIGEADPLPEPPQTFLNLSPADQERAREVWAAAQRLRAIIHHWQGWWIQLLNVGQPDPGDPDPGLALRYDDAASQAIEVLCRLKINAEPFSTLSPTDLQSILPPVPDGQLAHDRYEWEGNDANGQAIYRTVKVQSWQQRMRHDPRYWLERTTPLSQLVGRVSALISDLENYPLSVLFKARAEVPPADGIWHGAIYRNGQRVVDGIENRYAKILEYMWTADEVNHRAIRDDIGLTIRRTVLPGYVSRCNGFLRRAGVLWKLSLSAKRGEQPRIIKVPRR
jgi:hypothetical protein